MARPTKCAQRAQKSTSERAGSAAAQPPTVSPSRAAATENPGLGGETRLWAPAAAARGASVARPRLTQPAATPYRLPHAPAARFRPPCLPTKAPQPPPGGGWLHEIKHDGFRVIARKDGNRVRLYSRPGNDLTYRFPLIVESVARLRSRSCIIDGEAVCCGDDGVPSFDRIRYRRHDASGAPAQSKLLPPRLTRARNVTKPSRSVRNSARYSAVAFARSFSTRRFTPRSISSAASRRIRLITEPQDGGPELRSHYRLPEHGRPRSQRRSSKASGLCRQNSAASPQICAAFQGDTLRRHF
jgi:ATP dependent DNA ligase domain